MGRIFNAVSFLFMLFFASWGLLLLCLIILSMLIGIEPNLLDLQVTLFKFFLAMLLASVFLGWVGSLVGGASKNQPRQMERPFQKVSSRENT
jgi:hypothetical protein